MDGMRMGMGMRMRALGSFLAGAVFVFCHPALAQVEANFSAGGGVRIGWSTTTCNGTIIGAIRYNSGNGGSIDLCNGTVWKNASSGGYLNDLSDVYTNYAKGNMVLGHEAATLHANTMGNTALGTQALNSYAGTYGYHTAIGYRALASLSAGYDGQTAVGAYALEKQTGGQKNTAFGYLAANSQVSADGNTAIGFAAMTSNLDHANTCIGSHCLPALVYGTNNVSMGYNSGRLINNGSFNIVIGADAPGKSGVSYYLNIGDLIYGDMSANKYVGINNPNPAYNLDVVGNIAYTGVMYDISDQRLKENVQALPAALPHVMALKPISYTMKGDQAKKIEYGFIAQDVEKIYPILVATADDAEKTKSMNYIGLIAPLVKTFQEQQVLIDDQDLRIKRLEEKLEAKLKSSD